MARHVILGKGPIGRTLAQQLVDDGHEVLVLSRTGGEIPPSVGSSSAGSASAGHPRPSDRPIPVQAVDGTDAVALTRAARGADALYNCANPPYHRWPTDWPPIADALLGAAERTGAVLVTAGNLYAYGQGSGPMTETSPLRSTETKGRVRAAMWTEALRRHEAGLVRATEVRGSDYLGPNAEAHAHAGPRMLEPLLAGRPIRPIGTADVVHSWTYLPDFARALAAAAVTEPAWGKPWHVPSPEPLTLRDVARRFARAAGAPEPRFTPLPMGAVRLIGAFSPMMREIGRVGYQFVEPFVMESEASARTLGVAATPWPTIVAETLAARTARAAATV